MYMKRKISENSLKNLEKGKPFDANNADIARSAQEKSVKKRKENQALADLLKMALLLVDDESGEINQIAITNSLIKRAISGDVKAFEVIRDTIGEKPVVKQEIDGTLQTPTVIINREPVYVESDN
jgi:hypothetical protein